jgi:hypothetical protein
MRLNTGLPLCEMTSMSVSDGHHPWTKTFRIMPSFRSNDREEPTCRNKDPNQSPMGDILNS